MKLYLINLYESYRADEQGIRAFRELPKETSYTKYEVLEEIDIELPMGFTIEGTKGHGMEIFKGGECAEMITENIKGKYVTELVTSNGIVKLHTWEY